MRAFIGIEFPKEVKNSIIDVQKLIRENSIRGRWKYIDNFHMTLKFLGEVSRDQIDTIYKSMEANLKDIGKFHLKVGGLGVFEGNGCFRVVYLKVTDSMDMLYKAFAGVEDSCYSAGIPREGRPYTPHITIAQDVVVDGDFDYIKKQTERLSGIETDVERISIIKSEQIGGKRIYTPLRTLILK